MIVWCMYVDGKEVWWSTEMYSTTGKHFKPSLWPTDQSSVVLPLIKKPQWSPASFYFFHIYLFFPFQVHHFPNNILYTTYSPYTIPVFQYFTTPPFHSRTHIMLSLLCQLCFQSHVVAADEGLRVKTFCFYGVFLYAAISWEKHIILYTYVAMSLYSITIFSHTNLMVLLYLSVLMLLHWLLFIISHSFSTCHTIFLCFA